MRQSEHRLSWQRSRPARFRQPAPAAAPVAAQRDETWLFYAAAIPMALAMTVSGNLLDLVGLKYDLNGGSFFFKIHPAVYAALALTAYAFHDRLRVTLLRNPLILWFFILLGLSNLITIVLNPANGVHAIAQSLVSYVSAALIALVLAEASPAVRDKVARLLIGLAVLNATMCLFENLTQVNLIPVYLETGELPEFAGEFRGSALYDHPLDGAMFTLTGLLLLRARGIGGWRGQAAFLMLLVGLLSFGGRTAMAAGVLVMSLSAVLYFFTQLARGAMTPQFLLRALIITVVVPGFFALVLFDTNVGQRIAAHLYWDNSAQTRSYQFNILKYMTPHELLAGMSVDSMATAGYQIALYFPYEDIENFWLLEFVSLGLFGFLFWLAAFFCLMGYAWRRASGWGMVILVTLILVASTSNSFGRKSLVLNAVMAAVMTTAPVRREEPRMAPALRRLAPPA